MNKPTDKDYAAQAAIWDITNDWHAGDVDSVKARENIAQIIADRVAEAVKDALAENVLVKCDNGITWKSEPIKFKQRFFRPVWEE